MQVPQSSSKVNMNFNSILSFFLGHDEFLRTFWPNSIPNGRNLCYATFAIKSLITQDCYRSYPYKYYVPYLEISPKALALTSSTFNLLWHLLYSIFLLNLCI